MKKFLSMVMAAAMVVSLVPATAFAASGDVKATAKVVDAANFPVDGIKADEDTLAEKGKYPELQLTLTTSDIAHKGATVEFTVTLDNAKFEDSFGNADVYLSETFTGVSVAAEKTDDEDENEAKVTLTIAEGSKIDRGTVLGIALNKVTMDKVSKGKTATVSVDSDDATITNGDDLVFASVESESIKASVKDTVDVAEEEVATLKEVKIEAGVGNFEDFVNAAAGKDELKLKLGSGFEFVYDSTTRATISSSEGSYKLESSWYDDDEIVIPLDWVKADIGLDVDTWKLNNLKVEATSAKAGSTATMKVYLTGCDKVSVEVAKVVDYTVSMTVDEDEDVPVIYSGVDVANTGITDDSAHETLEVTIKESFAGAWNNSKDFTLSVPEGVYIVDVVDPSFDNDGQETALDEAKWFAEAYNEGDYVDLTFKRRSWAETTPDKGQDPAELTFTLVLVADPNFEGDVVLKLTGDAVEEQEVTIAKFVKPFVVEAQQNDMQIDYRNTEIPTSVVIKEAEAGLWEKGTEFRLALDKISFDDEGTIKVDDKSGLEVKDDEVKTTSKGVDNDVLYFTVDSRSDDEPAVVTISGMQLYMQRSLPAGAYDLDVYSPTMLGVEKDENDQNGKGYLGEKVLGMDLDKEVDCIADINDDFYSETAKAGFVNIVTAGREDTESFTTKVVVPVGESYLISGENKVTIDVPAYINANGYTMLPLRAVAVALGINSNNVLWDQSTRTATIMYGSKIINMTLGQKVVYVNGAMIPATAAVEITNDRMFLGLRDLGNALGVTDITWDGATRTATLNGNK